MAGLRQSHMTQSDLLSLNMEQDPVLRSTIISVVILDTDPDWDRLVATMERGTHVVSRFREKLVAVPVGLAPPRWTTDPDFDLSWHLRRVNSAPPADISCVLEFARTAAMSAFDKDRPLWEFTLLGGLEGGQSALVLKLHHSLTDGIGGVQIASQILDFVREGTDRGPLPEVDQPAAIHALVDALGWNLSVGADLALSGASAILPTARRTLRNPVAAAHDAAELATSVARFVRPIADTLSPQMTERSTGRNLAVLDVPLESLHSAATACGSTLNSAFLTAVLIGLRTYHEHHGSTPQKLRVCVPISLRTDADPVGGNRITLARCEVPVDVGDDAELMRQVGAKVGSSRREPAVALSSVIAATLNMLPTNVIAEMLKHVDFVATDVPGSPVPLYLAGAKILRYYAFGPTLGAAFNIALMSHAGTCFIGINADTAAVPDLPDLVGCVAAGFHTVLELGADRPINTAVAASIATSPG